MKALAFARHPEAWTSLLLAALEAGDAVHGVGHCFSLQIRRLLRH
jgi:hypothetical protein